MTGAGPCLAVSMLGRRGNSISTLFDVRGTVLYILDWGKGDVARGENPRRRQAELVDLGRAAQSFDSLTRRGLG